MYRLYIDETGTGDLKASADPNHRFLSLTGIVMSKKVAAKELYPQFEGIKEQHLGGHPDSPVVFHRKDMMEGKPPFQRLKDPAKRAAFDKDLLKSISEVDYMVVTAVIDKQQHLAKYKVWQHDPYHYCLQVLLERYVQWLQRHGSTGDVWGEVRSGKHDRRLEKCFTGLYTNGTDYVPAKLMQERLTSKDIKLRPKPANIAGLQLADLIAHPSCQLARHQKLGDVTPIGFAQHIADILLGKKYHRSFLGKIKGYGIKWLP